MSAPTATTAPALAAGHHEPSKFHFYIQIAMILAVITGIEVVLIYLPIAKWLVVTTLIVLSTVKFMFVIFYFMHLRWDKVFCTILFFIGVAFCYFFVFGQVFAFIQSYAPKSITAAPDIEAYLSFVLSMFLAFGMAFEVPIVVIVLARMKVVSIEKLKAFRSYFVVLAFVIAAIVTPPDVVSQLALAIPMCILYEIGIWAAQLFIKHTQAPDAE